MIKNQSGGDKGGPLFSAVAEGQVPLSDSLPRSPMRVLRSGFTSVDVNLLGVCVRMCWMERRKRRKKKQIALSSLNI